MSVKENVFVNVEDRIFYIHDSIDETSISTVCYWLLHLLKEDQDKENTEKDFNREPIKIYINSIGGNVLDMWALVDIMMNSKTPIYTYSTGYAFSSAFMIFIAGSKRFITKHTKMCYHQFSSEISGPYQCIKEEVDDKDKMWEQFEGHVHSQTKITKEKLKEVREKKLNWYIYSDEAIKLGIATEFVDNF